jgi:hypothetical protein
MSRRLEAQRTTLESLIPEARIPKRIRAFCFVRALFCRHSFAAIGRRQQGGSGTRHRNEHAAHGFPHEGHVPLRRQDRRFVDTPCVFLDWRSIMEEAKLAGRSWSAEVVAVLGAMLASVLSFGVVVVLYASASGELEVAVAKARAAPAASAVAVEVPRKPKPG